MKDGDGGAVLQTFCPLCLARCGAKATVEDGRFVALNPDPSHPTGKALCAKGRAAPELVYSEDRLLYPMKRTRPKDDPDPGWTRISWDEAFGAIAAAIRRTTEQHGPESVAFTTSSPSTSSISDSISWIRRLMNAIGTPNVASNLELCGWGRAMATLYTYGIASVGVGPGSAMADIENAGCLILWGYNPSMTRLTHGTAISAALKRGMRLIVIDPRQVGLANKADAWLRIRPGTDGALALGLANLMIERGEFDHAFVRDWSNGPFLVRSDTGCLLSEADIRPGGDPGTHILWNMETNSPSAANSDRGSNSATDISPALRGTFTVETQDGPIECRTVFDAYADLCSKYTPEIVETICWVDPDDLRKAANLIWSSRPTAYYAYSGHEQHTNTSQAARAISLLYALTGSFDQKGGNVLFPIVPNAPITGEDLDGVDDMAPAIGFEKRPLGPAKFRHITSRDLYTAILDDDPYPVRSLIGFGANLLVAHIVADRGVEALKALDFFVHTDLFLNPTAQFADIILPAASPFESEALRIGFEVSPDAQAHVQLRQQVIEPLGDCRSDMQIVFGIAKHLGLDDAFFGGEIERAWAHQLAPSGLTVDELRAAPGGVRIPLSSEYRKFAAGSPQGPATGFPTPSGKVEIWSESFQEAGYDPLPEFIEPDVGPASRPDLHSRFPLVLTSAKSPLYCNSQHRGVASLRKRQLDPTIAMHSACAKQRGISEGDWVRVESPVGRMRAKAVFNDTLDTRVVVGHHGWWQACDVIAAPNHDPFGADGPNYNNLIGDAALDPISGTAPHKSFLCEISKTT